MSVTWQSGVIFTTKLKDLEIRLVHLLGTWRVEVPELKLYETWDGDRSETSKAMVTALRMVGIALGEHKVRVNDYIIDLRFQHDDEKTDPSGNSVS